MSAPPPAASDRPRLCPIEQCGDVLDHRERFVRPSEAKPAGLEHTSVRLHRQDVILVRVVLSILRAARAAILLTRPANRPDRAARLKAEFLHDANGFPRGNHTARVIHRAGSDVPGIDVTAEHDDLVWKFAAHDFPPSHSATEHPVVCGPPS